MKAYMNILSAFIFITLFSACLSHNDRAISSVESSPAVPLEDSILKEETFGELHFGPEPFYETENHNLSAPIEDSGEHSIYTTKGSETLMWIGFEAYSDYRAWKKIHAANKEILKDVSGDLPAGLQLKLPHPVNPYTPAQGRPYLIKEKDSLSKISKKVYGTWKLWPEIYENNKKQIRFPNLIFAGFTLFYPSEPLKRNGTQPH